MVDYNKFSRVTVTGSAFTEEMSVSFDFRPDENVVLTLTAGTGAEDVVLDNATIAAGAPVKINSATYTAPV